MLNSENLGLNFEDIKIYKNFKNNYFKKLNKKDFNYFYNKPCKSGNFSIKHKKNITDFNKLIVKKIKILKINKLGNFFNKMQYFEYPSTTKLYNHGGKKYLHKRYKNQNMLTLLLKFWDKGLGYMLKHNA